MADDTKARKSILKSNPSIFIPRPDPGSKQSSVARSSGNRGGSSGSHGGGHIQLGVPAFFGGVDRKMEREASNHSHLTMSSGNRSFHSLFEGHHARGSRRVRFLDRDSIKSISAIFVPSDDMEEEAVIGPEREGDACRRQLNVQDIQDDPYYLPGFVDLYYATELTVKEDTCCCSTSTHFKIVEDSTAKVIYSAELIADGAFASFMKLCCFRKYDIMRIGFTIRVYNKPVNGTKLLMFKRKTYWFAEQQDIVETYYSIENAHVGRIEKTQEGYRLVDTRGTETYRIFKEGNMEKKLMTNGGTLLVFSCLDKRAVAKITYWKRTFLGRISSSFMQPLKHKIKWSQDIGVAMKTLLLGVLFLELHSVEEYVDLPLGKDAIASTENPKHYRRQTGYNYLFYQQ